MEKKMVKCIKNVYSDNLQFLNEFSNDEEIHELFDYPIQKLFTKDKNYYVEATENGEWRTKDDICGGSTPYNHILKGLSGDLSDWFHEHFILV